ncbi:hypothetical protein BaRGS_00015073 [Batillaria attramentaria]|uniref:Uncharacterized protein n=1 Tax=Batillaria attramentaria TaxID=370345 RepID=A0ABD0L2X0_9CAEN
MKCVVVCLALCVVVMAQDQVLTTTHLPHTGSHVNALEHLIRQEVHDILAADTDHKMNVVACSEKCDAEFALISSHAEGGHPSQTSGGINHLNMSSLGHVIHAITAASLKGLTENF